MMSLTCTLVLAHMMSWHNPHHALNSLTLEICSVACVVSLSPGEKHMLRDEHKPDGNGGYVCRGEKTWQSQWDIDWVLLEQFQRALLYVSMMNVADAAKYVNTSHNGGIVKSICTYTLWPMCTVLRSIFHTFFQVRAMNAASIPGTLGMRAENTLDGITVTQGELRTFIVNTLFHF